MCSPTDDLGSRDLDRVYNWISYIGRDLIVLEDWEQFKFLYPIDQAVTVDTDPGSLNTE